MNAAVALRTARARQGWTQRSLEARSGTLQPSLARIERRTESPSVDRLNRILAGADAQITLLPTRTPTVADWAPDLEYVATNDPDGVPKTLVVISDALRAADPALRVALCVTPPLVTGTPYVDALLAALVEWTLSKDGLPVPEWVHDHGKAAEEPWDLIDHAHVRDALRARTPEPFARRNVFLPPEFFDSV